MENYRQIKLLGEGAFGKAYLVEAPDKTKCVIKQMDISSMSDAERRDALREAKILEAFNHPNIITFREVYKTKKGKLCIVMDFADGGDLATAVTQQRGRHFDEGQVLNWFVQLCLALKHVHDRKVLHRDIKSQNVFLTRSKMVKLGDFGIARVLNHTRENAKTMVGTPYYLSPEIVGNKPYSFKSDVWSLGVLLYELCALKPPFDAPSLHALALKIQRGYFSPLPNAFSQQVKGLVSQMLQVDPGRRPTIGQILKMGFVQQRIQNFLSESVRINEFSHTILHRQNVWDAAKNPPGAGPGPSGGANAGPPRPPAAVPQARAAPSAAARPPSARDQAHANLIAEANRYAAEKRVDMERQRAEADRRREEDAKRRLDDIKRKRAEDEENRRRVEERKAEERRRAEQQRAEERRRLAAKAEELKRVEEARRAEAQRKYEEERRRAIQRAKEEAKRKEERRQREEKKKTDDARKAEQERLRAEAKRQDDLRKRAEEFARNKARCEAQLGYAQPPPTPPEPERQQIITPPVHNQHQHPDIRDQLAGIVPPKVEDLLPAHLLTANQKPDQRPPPAQTPFNPNAQNWYVPPTPEVESAAPPATSDGREQTPPQVAPASALPPRRASAEPQVVAPEDSGGAGAFFIQFDKKKKGKRGKKKKGNRPGAATPKAKPSEPIPFLQRSNSENRTDPEEEEQRPQPTRPESAVASEERKVERNAARNEFREQLAADRKKMKKKKKANVQFELVGYGGCQIVGEGSPPKSEVSPRAPPKDERRPPSAPAVPVAAPPACRQEESKHVTPKESPVTMEANHLYAVLENLNAERLLLEQNDRDEMISHLQSALAEDNEEEEEKQIEIVVQCNSDEEREDQDFDEQTPESSEPSTVAPEDEQPPAEFSGFSKLEALKIYLEEKLGTDAFIAAYQIVKENQEFDCASQEDVRNHFSAKLNHIIDLDTQTTFLPLIQTLVFLEETVE